MAKSVLPANYNTRFQLRATNSKRILNLKTQKSKPQRKGKNSRYSIIGFLDIFHPFRFKP